MSGDVQPYWDRLGPASGLVVDAVLRHWPEHEKFLHKSFESRSDELLGTTEVIASLLAKVAAKNGGSIATFAEDYRYLCEEIVFPEELFFRREGRYRLSTFDEAASEIYNNNTVMIRYLNGLFVSDALWLNHPSAMNDFANAYLPTVPFGGDHLEIGPGHGMLLHLAVRAERFKSLAAWDVSATSIEHTRLVLSLLGEESRVELTLQDVYSPEALTEHHGQFHSIVLSEVLEHLERPREAIEIIGQLLAPGGSVWINVPLNGPAPDHLFLLRSPREAVDLVAATGLNVARSAAYPVAGASLDRALRQDLPISFVIVGAKGE